MFASKTFDNDDDNDDDNDVGGDDVEIVFGFGASCR